MQIDSIRQLPEYKALTQARNKIIWPLSVVTVLVYFAFILTIAFAPQLLGTPVSDGTTSWGVVLGLSIILFCLLITGIYVYYANHVLEPLTHAIAKKVENA